MEILNAPTLTDKELDRLQQFDRHVLTMPLQWRLAQYSPHTLQGIVNAHNCASTG
jgi:hypothetical protein